MYIRTGFISLKHPQACTRMYCEGKMFRNNFDYYHIMFFSRPSGLLSLSISLPLKVSHYFSSPTSVVTVLRLQLVNY